MTIISVIIVGGIIGWLASRLMGRHEGFFGSVIIGIVGSFIGSLLAQLFNANNASYMTFRWANLIWALIGSIILVAIINAFSARRHHHQV